jgi:hypothetical protein
MTQVVLAVLSVSGALVGVALGALLNARVQRTSWERQEYLKSAQDRRVMFAAYVAACREWRATVLGPDVRILRASSVSRKPHADGGEARTKVIRLRTELALVAHTAETIRTGVALMRAVGELSEARANYEVGQVPETFLQPCRDAEREFIRAVRAELGSPDIDLKTATQWEFDA